jgi:hypothetical protein
MNSIRADPSKPSQPVSALDPIRAPGGRGFGMPMREEDWVKRMGFNGKLTGEFADYNYIGTGDTGGG